ncbi:unnamed protein product [Orchesella dallaii]|uniref:Zinc finger protein n=1 Tax=Orchesella dallaii TaxID=48710 RepID=A0ABP1QDM9_9HEXA
MPRPGTRPRSLIIRCYVPNCSNRKTVCDPKITFFSFPRGWRSSAWMEAIKRPDMTINSNCRVCSVHFSESDFEPNLGNVLGEKMKDRLTKEAIPSLKLPASLEEARKWEKIYTNRKSVKKRNPSTEPVFQKTAEKKKPSPIELCLICSEAVQQADYINVSLYKFPGAEESRILNEQLWNTFILKTIINFPASKYQELLFQTGTRLLPSSWFVLCKDCSGFVENIAKMLDKIKALEFTVEEKIKSIKNKFEKNLLKDCEGCNCNTNTKDLCVRNEIRSFMSAPTEQLVVKKERADSDEEFIYDAGGDNHSFEGEPPIGSKYFPLPQTEIEGSKDESETETGAIKDKSDEKWVPLLNTERKCSDSDPEADLGLDVEDSNERDFSKKFCKRGTYKTKNKKFNCLKCKATYSKIPCLRVHLLKRHALVLEEKWDGNTPVMDHVTSNRSESSSNPRLFTCSICSRIQQTKIKLNLHMKLHVRSKGVHGGAFDCFMCKAPYFKADSVRLHLQRDHRLKLASDWDGTQPQENHIGPLRIVKQPKRIKKAEAESEVKQSYSCKLCPCEFSDSRMFQFHEEDHQKSKKASQNCPKCNYPCVTALKLNRHLISKHKVSVYMCKICGVDSRTAQKLGDHMLNHKIHDGSIIPGSDLLLCSICDKTFKNRRALSFHKLSYHSEELELTVFRCQECPRVFAKKLPMRVHVLKEHKNLTKFRCETCGYGAINQSVLKRHMYIHTTEKFMCEHCSATYSHPLALNQHIKQNHPDCFTHKKKLYHPAGGEKPPKPSMMEVKCKYCYKILPHKLGLKHHLESEHRDLYTHKCDLCDKVYMSVASVQLHRKLNHTETDNTVICKWCLKTVSHTFYMYSHTKHCSKNPANRDLAAANEEEKEETVNDSDEKFNLD